MDSDNGESTRVVKRIEGAAGLASASRSVKWARLFMFRKSECVRKKEERMFVGRKKCFV